MMLSEVEDELTVSMRYALGTAACWGPTSLGCPPDARRHSPFLSLLVGVEHPLLGYGTYKVGVVPASASDTNVQIGRTTSEVVKVGDWVWVSAS